LNIALNANARDLAAHHQALLCLDFLELLNVATIPGPMNSNALNTRGNNIVTRIEDARPRLAAVSARDARHLGRHTITLIAAALSDRPGARETLSTFALQSMVELAAGSLGKQAWFATQDLLPEEPVQPARITPLRTFLRELWRYLSISVFLLAAFVAFELKLKPTMQTSPWDMLAMGVRTVFVLLGLTIAGSLIKRVFPEAPDPTKTVLDLFKNK
jgi:hypothetical protein